MRFFRIYANLTGLRVKSCNCFRSCGQCPTHTKNDELANTIRRLLWYNLITFSCVFIRCFFDVWYEKKIYHTNPMIGQQFISWTILLLLTRWFYDLRKLLRADKYRIRCAIRTWIGNLAQIGIHDHWFLIAMSPKLSSKSCSKYIMLKNETFRHLKTK